MLLPLAKHLKNKSQVSFGTMELFIFGPTFGGDYRIFQEKNYQSYMGEGHWIVHEFMQIYELVKSHQVMQKGANNPQILE